MGVLLFLQECLRRMMFNPLEQRATALRGRERREKLNIKFEEPANVNVMVDSTGSTMEELF